MIQFQFNADKKNKKKADLYLYDVIGDSWDGTTARQFAADLAALGSLDELNIFMNSPGGVVTDGLAIYNTLVRNKAVKNMFIDGLAGSIASVVAMAGDKIVTAKNASWMIHNPYMFVMGDADELRHWAKRLDALRDTIVGAYTDRSNGKATEKQFGAWMDEEKWFSAQEALAAGLTDEVSEKDIAIAACSGLAKFDFSKFKNVPDSLKQLVASVKAQAPSSTAPAEKRQPLDVTRRKARVLQITSARRTA